jgi:hypothetical protein
VASYRVHRNIKRPKSKLDPAVDDRTYHHATTFRQLNSNNGGIACSVALTISQSSKDTMQQVGLPKKTLRGGWCGADVRSSSASQALPSL